MSKSNNLDLVGKEKTPRRRCDLRREELDPTKDRCWLEALRGKLERNSPMYHVNHVSNVFSRS